MPTRKPSLVILSDMWGDLEPQWAKRYVTELSSYFLVTTLDSRCLAEVSVHLLDEQALHQQFVNGGVARAVDQLLKNEAGYDYALGFSIGGTILWRAVSGGLKINHLFAVSATRLRYEVQRPSCNINLYYGENDPNRPNSAWFNLMDLKPNLIANQGHELYRNEVCIKDICLIIKEL